MRAIEALKKFYQGKRVLVTGNTGFKGSWLAYWLKTMGADVYGISLPATASQKILFEALNLTQPVLTYYQDIAVFEPVAKLIQSIKPEIVFHLAAQPILKTSYLNPLHTYSSNVTGTVNILESIRQYPEGIKAAVMVTTDKCYKNKEDGTSYIESDELGGFDPYSSSKACCELIIESYRASYFNKTGLGLASARGGNILGGGDFGDNRLVPDMVETISLKKPLVLRLPEGVRPWQYVLDAVYGYLLLGMQLYLKPKQYSQAFNFSNPLVDKVTVLNLVKLFLDKIKAQDTVIQLERSDFCETKYLQLNSNKAMEQVGWKPLFSLEEMIGEISDWYFHYLNKMDLSLISQKLIENFENRAELICQG